jgi:transposase-like protein
VMNTSPDESSCYLSESRTFKGSSYDGIVNLVGHRQLGRAMRCLEGSTGCSGWGRAGLVEAGAPSYKGFRFPVEIISPCVWLYHRFLLSFREVEEMMLEREVVVSHETVRQWCGKFGQIYANGLRRRRARPGDKWHLDEVFIKIGGKTHYLWRAVDQHGDVLDILVTSRRDANAATRFFRKLLTGLRYVPRVLVTDKLASYGVAHRRLMPGVEHRRSKYLNNRAGRTCDMRSHETSGLR